MAQEKRRILSKAEQKEIRRMLFRRSHYHTDNGKFCYSPYNKLGHKSDPKEHNEKQRSKISREKHNCMNCEFAHDRSRGEADCGIYAAFETADEFKRTMRDTKNPIAVTMTDKRFGMSDRKYRILDLVPPCKGKMWKAGRPFRFFQNY